MGSPLRLTLVGINRSLAASCWAAVQRAFAEVDEELSLYRSDTPLARLNERAGTSEPEPVPAILYRAVTAAHRAWRATDGRFDPRVLSDLRELGQPRAAAPSSSASQAPTPRRWGCDGWLVRAPRRRALAIAAPLDLDGIGKGLALRLAFRRIAERVELGSRAGCLLDAGGDLVGGGRCPDRGPWRIEIENPAAASGGVGVVALERGAVCTSSVRLGQWVDADGRRMHHLIDPATHQPGGDGLLAVTVAGPDPAWAEVWTKALFLRGATGIGDAARRLGLAAWWVDADGVLSMTPAARLRTLWP